MKSLLRLTLAVLLVTPTFGQPDFIRGDCNNDGSNNIADAVNLLSFLFPMGPPPTLPCEDACDGNDDGSLNIADAVAILNSLFGTPATPLPAPYPGCGQDLAPDSLVCTPPVTACPSIPPTVFRISTLALRDPHVSVSLIFCLDVTDGPLSINEAIDDSLNASTTTPGILDLSNLLIFRPLDQSTAMGTVEFAVADCTAPVATTSCNLQPLSVPIPLTYMTSASGAPCLAPNPTHLSGYSPGVTNSTTPCFSTVSTSLSVSLGGIPVMLEDAQVAGTFVGNPATQITNGLMLGFISEANAQAITIPATIAVVGGQTLASVLIGGAGNCSSGDDRDVGPDGVTMGWWIHLNYTAVPVTYTGP
ncbi:MAG: dockerin type I repeat-containing protein [Planctomycetota bacterium]